MNLSTARLLVLAGWAATALAGAPVLAVTIDEVISDLPSAAQEKIKVQIGTFLKAKVPAVRSANDLGWDCMAAARLTEMKHRGAKGLLEEVADRQLAAVEHSHLNGMAIGWGASRAHEPTCVTDTGDYESLYCDAGHRTLYAFQTGLGMACLSLAGKLLERSDYLETAKAVSAYWYLTRKSKAPCPGCIYFAISDSASDKARYVRNMNIFMAFGFSHIDAATQNIDHKDISLQAVRSDMWERQNGNRGYLGKLDSLWSARPDESKRIENHAAGNALILDEIAKLLRDGQVADHAFITWKDWATCQERRCKIGG